MKYAASILDENIKRVNVPAFKVVDMHDEAQWECVNDPTAIEFLERGIERAFEQASNDLKLRCPQEPDVKVGKTWAETH